MHPTYKPDLTPSDYQLLLSMTNDLAGELLASNEACGNWLPQFCDNMDKSFSESQFKANMMYDFDTSTKINASQFFDQQLKTGKKDLHAFNQ